MTIPRSLIAASVLVLSSAFAQNNAKDPFLDMSFHTLENGMRVVLAPNKNSKNIELKVVVGFGRFAETRENLQAGHVLEHMLFKDGNIENNKSYLEIIKEEGGNVNAYVTNDHTAYHTTIASDKSSWLIQKFREMIFSRKLDEHELSLGKSSVILEIGKPFAINRILGANPINFISSNYFPEKSFYEYEFGVPEYNYSRENEKLSVNNLKLEQIQNVYDNYYQPSNMKLFLSGNFDRIQTLKQIKSLFSNIPDKDGLRMPDRSAKHRGDDFLSSKVGSDGKSQIYYGLKLFNRKIDELLALDAYFNYVAHRLMIELRNKKGETYTAYSHLDYNNKAGISYVAFQTQNEKYEINKNSLIKMIEEEAINGNISDEDINKAVDLFLKERYEITDVDAEGLMNLALLYEEMKYDLNLSGTPYSALKEMTSETFRSHLKTVFKEEKKYIYEYVAPIAFNLDILALMLITIMSSVFVFRKLWLSKVDAITIKWVEKTSLTPGIVPEVLTILVFAFAADYFASRPIEYLIENTNTYRNSILLSHYLMVVLGFTSVVGLSMWVMCKLPSKVIFTGEGFIIHSLILKQCDIKLGEIKKMTILGPLAKCAPKVVFSSKFGMMSFLFNNYFWRSGILIETYDQGQFLLNVRNAKSFKELFEKEVSNFNSSGDMNQAA